MMLTRLHKILIGLLAVQLLLVFVFVVGGGGGSSSTVEKPLLAGFDAAKVTRIQVFGPGVDAARPVDLVKKGAEWTLASGYDFPVEPKHVEDLLGAIGKMAAASPVGTKAARHRQYKVADDEFERRLVIGVEGGGDTTVYVGGNAGPRRTAVRLGGDDRVYAVTGLSASAAGTDPGAWIKAEYTKGATDDVAAVTIVHDGKPPIELKRLAVDKPDAGSGSDTAPDPLAPKWAASIGGAPVEPGPNEKLDADTIEQAVGAVVNFNASAPGDPKRDASRPAATITVVRKADKIGASPTTTFDVIADGERYWLKARDLPRAILVEKSRLTSVMELTRDKLIKKPPPPAPKQPDEPGPGGDELPPVPPPP
ncbi:MAG: DUF4340 domain-containing protein [Deltaproteobacteria bacterium]|nr:DUF4340 domain-containing protein [Deltaproteobacteria bacterium]MCW5803273.1 DUF4340 domain-containing protein [Deltaproteobacteria bacterium]